MTYPHMGVSAVKLFINEISLHWLIVNYLFFKVVSVYLDYYNSETTFPSLLNMYITNLDYFSVLTVTVK